MLSSFQSPDSTTVTFHQDKVYELVMFSVKEDKFEQLVSDYLPKAMPIVTEYGGKPLITFQVNTAKGIDQPIQAIALWEWPSVEAFTNISQDSRIEKIIPIRQDALSYIDEANFFKIAQSKTITFHKNTFYNLISEFSTESNEKKTHAMVSMKAIESSNNSYSAHKIFIKESSHNDLSASVDQHQFSVTPNIQ